jgi:chemotaxis signal transduction protein
MSERVQTRQFLAIVFLLRGRLHALEQRGAATLLPWLQRYAPPSGAPGLPEWCWGLLNVRGAVQLIVDLGGMMGHGPSAISEHSRLIFIEHGAAQLGLVVDREVGVRTLRPGDAAHDSGVPFAASGAFLEDRPVLVLDGAAIIRQVAEALHAPAYVR